jgi:hypothetical protein
MIHMPMISLARFTPGAIAVAFATSLSAQTYLLDFNTADTSGYPQGSSAWNIYAAPTDINGGLIKSTTGSTAAGLTLSKSGTMTDSANSGSVNVFGNTTGGPSWLTNNGTLGNTGAAGDYFYTSTNSTVDSFTMTVGGLTAGSAVTLDLWMSRSSGAGGDGFFDYSMDGGGSWTGFKVAEKSGVLSTDAYWSGNTTASTTYRAYTDGWVGARYMTSQSVVMTGTTLIFRATDATTTGGWTGIGAVQLQVSAIPEPHTYAAAFGAVAFVYGATRRRPRG